MSSVVLHWSWRAYWAAKLGGGCDDPEMFLVTYQKSAEASVKKNVRWWWRRRHAVRLLCDPEWLPPPIDIYPDLWNDLVTVAEAREDNDNLKLTRAPLCWLLFWCEAEDDDC